MFSTIQTFMEPSLAMKAFVLYLDTSESGMLFSVDILLQFHVFSLKFTTRERRPSTSISGPSGIADAADSIVVTEPSFASA